MFQLYPRLPGVQLKQLILLHSSASKFILWLRFLWPEFFCKKNVGATVPPAAGGTVATFFLEKTSHVYLPGFLNVSKNNCYHGSLKGIVATCAAINDFFGRWLLHAWFSVQEPIQEPRSGLLLPGVDMVDVRTVVAKAGGFKT